MNNKSYPNFLDQAEKNHKPAFDDTPELALVIPINSETINNYLKVLNDDILTRLKIPVIDPFEKWWENDCQNHYLRNTFAIPIAYYDIDNNFSSSSYQMMKSYTQNLEGFKLSLKTIKTTDNSKITAIFKPEDPYKASQFVTFVTRKLRQTIGITNIIEENTFETLIHYSEQYEKKSEYFYEDRIDEKNFTFNKLLTVTRKSCNELLNEMRYKSENFIALDEKTSITIKDYNYRYYNARLSQPVMYQIIHSFKLKNI